MPKTRKALVSLEATPYYHCVSRCVRRAFLCGSDDYSGKDYEHRRQWIAQRMKELAAAFSIDLCAYAVISNHYHVVLHVDRDLASSWEDSEVVAHWKLLFAGHPRNDMSKGLPFRLQDYLELVEWTGRILREDKRGYIPSHYPPILERLQIDTKHWLYMTQGFESRFKGPVGTAFKLKAACSQLGYKRTPNLAVCQWLLSG